MVVSILLILRMLMCTMRSEDVPNYVCLYSLSFSHSDSGLDQVISSIYGAQGDLSGWSNLIMEPVILLLHL